MGVYSRKLSKGVRWLFRGQYLSNKYCSKCIYLTKQEAKKAEREYISRVDKEARNPTNCIMLLSLMNDRLDELQAKRSVQYYKDTKRYFKQLLDYIGDVEVSQITKKQLHELFAREAKRLADKGSTNHKLREMQRIIHALFEWGIKIHDLDIRNPAHGLGLYPIEQKLKHIPTDAEIEEVYGKLTPARKVLFDFVQETGCRINEAVRFFNNPEIAGEQVVLWTRKAKNSTLTPRFVPRPACITADFKGLAEACGDYQHSLGNAARSCGQKPWAWHNLRHRRASIWANSGMSTLEIMQRLGHSNISTTMGYLRLLGFTRA
ncbi:MAG: tyrosine-type recombinase/integrase [Nitrospirae bacterium]|nr:tyrosine-type recombinase/integrase [Nitrospirota bacterium]